MRSPAGQRRDMRSTGGQATNLPEIRAAKSIVDYIFRWMGEEVPHDGPAGGDRDPLAGSASAAGGIVQRAGGQAGGRRCGGRSRPAGANGAVQCVRGRPGVRQVRRPDGQDGQLLHVPRLRD